MMAGPKFFSSIDYDRLVYYEEVLNSLRYARKLAVATNAHIQVNLSATDLTLRSRTEGSDCTTGTHFGAIIDPTTKTPGYVKTAPGPVILSFSKNWPIYFNGLGQAFKADDCTVLKTGAPGTWVSIVGGNTVTVIGETGLSQ